MGTTSNNSKGKQHSKELILNILNLYADGNYTSKSLSNVLNISEETINGILLFKTTKHIDISTDLKEKI